MFFNQLFFFVWTVLCCAVDQFEYDCGLEATAATSLVRGGEIVEANAFPWQVAIFKSLNGQFGQICGGSLVRSELVITVAHCFSANIIDHQVNVEDYRVVGGSLLATWTARSIGRQEKKVRAVRLGERYGGTNRNYQDDIAVVHLSAGFTFSLVVRAVCLDLVDRELHNAQISPGSVGKVAGWGLTESGDPSDNLKFLSVPVVGDEQCTQQIFNTYPSFTSYITVDKICAGLNNGSAVCQGDSGAGLVFPLQTTGGSPPRWYLRGLLSNAPNSNMEKVCQFNAVALYTNVFTHREWLSTVMHSFQPQEACRLKGSTGVCREYSACPRAMEEIARGIALQYCSPSNNICCVDSAEIVEPAQTCPPLPSSAFSHRKTGSKAQDYCLDLREKLYPCQQDGSRGDLCGPDPQKHNPRYLVVPFTKASATEIQRFGFVSVGLPVYLISERWLLTKASHWDSLLRRGLDDTTPSSEVVFSVIRTVTHPQYIRRRRTVSATNNILLAEMDRPVPFSWRYRPVCLHTAQDSVGGLTLTTWDGWRDREPATFLSEEKCGRKFPPGSEGASGGVTESHLCVTNNISELDCGHPSKFLLASNGHSAGGCTQLLVGLALAGKIEGNCTELYLRVSSYIPWVESVVWP